MKKIKMPTKIPKYKNIITRGSLNRGHAVQIGLIALIMLFQSKLSDIFGFLKVLIVIISLVAITTIYALRVTRKIHKERMKEIDEMYKLNVGEVYRNGGKTN